MRLIKFIVLFSALITRICLAGIMIETAQPQQSSLVEAAVNILKFCYVKRVRTVGLVGNAARTINELLWVQEYIPVILIDKTTRIANRGPVQPESRRKLQIFVVTATTPTIFAETLKEIKESIFWNHMASFLILDWSIHGCSNSFKVLWTAWEMDLLGANFMCFHERKGRLIYTYNPYTSKAPEPWRLEKTYSGMKNHIWTLFSRKYRENEKNCEELDLDKAKDLGGYEIRSTVTNSLSALTNFTRSASGAVHFGGIAGKITSILFAALNATPDYLNATTYGFIDHTGKPHGGIAEVVNGISDMSLSIYYHINTYSFTTTRPIYESGPSIVTRYGAHASQLSKIASLFDVYSRYGLGLVYAITLVFFISFFRQSLISAFLNTVLIVCNAGLNEIPNKLAPRIYLGCLFIFIVNIQGIFQGNLASLLSKNVPIRNVNSKQDLIDLDYKIYGSSRLSRYFIDPISQKRYVHVENKTECIKIVLADSAAACISEKVVLIGAAAEFKLHLSNEQITNLYWVFLLRDNWPPEKALNTILARLVEADLVRLIYDEVTRKALRRLQANEDEENDQSVKVLELKDLSFAFVLLSIGLVCAIICFIIEIRMRAIRVKIANARGRIRRRLG